MRLLWCGLDPIPDTVANNCELQRRKTFNPQVQTNQDAWSAFPLMWLHGVELIGYPPNSKTMAKYCLMMRLVNAGLEDCEGTADSVFGLWPFSFSELQAWSSYTKMPAALSCSLYSSLYFRGLWTYLGAGTYDILTKMAGLDKASSWHPRKIPLWTFYLKTYPIAFCAKKHEQENLF